MKLCLRALLIFVLGFCVISFISISIMCIILIDYHYSYAFYQPHSSSVTNHSITIISYSGNSSSFTPITSESSYNFPIVIYTAWKVPSNYFILFVKFFHIVFVDVIFIKITNDAISSAIDTYLVIFLCLTSKFLSLLIIV